jgi:hypothetical protein
LSSERAPQDEEQSNCPAKERKKKYLVMGPKGVPDTKTDKPTDRQSQHQLNSEGWEIHNIQDNKLEIRTKQPQFKL